MNGLRAKYKFDTIVMVIILTIPILNYIHLSFSSESNIIKIFNYYFLHNSPNNELFVWYIFNDFIPLTLLLLMFFTSRYLWRLFTLPLILFFLIGFLVSSQIFIDFIEVLFSITGVIIGIITIISVILIDQYIFRSFRHQSFEFRLKNLITNKLKDGRNKIKNELNSIRRGKYNLTTSHYAKKIFYLKQNLDKSLKIDYLNNINTKNNERKGIDILIVSLLIFINILWFLPNQIPDEITTISIFGWDIGSYGFKNFNTFLWFVSRKLIVIVFLAIWFITSEYWWKYAILSPLILYSYQFWEAFQNVQHLDAYGNLKVLPLVALNVLVVAGISKWVKYHNDLVELNEFISKEVEELLDQLKGNESIKINEVFEKIKRKYQGKDRQAYASELKALEKELLSRISLLK